jgi:hypothetical protein
MMAVGESERRCKLEFRRNESSLRSHRDCVGMCDEKGEWKRGAGGEKSELELRHKSGQSFLGSTGQLNWAGGE